MDQLKSNFNYKLEYKRVLNFDNVVSDEDNIRQNIVDASDKKSTEEEQQPEAEEEVNYILHISCDLPLMPMKVEDDEEEDDLESFLAA